MPVFVERVVELSSDRSQLWCAIGDTERMNRAVGLGPLEVSPNSDATAARYLVRTVSRGFALEYEERPFEWVENEHFRIHRADASRRRALDDQRVLAHAVAQRRHQRALSARGRAALAPVRRRSSSCSCGASPAASCASCEQVEPT